MINKSFFSGKAGAFFLLAGIVCVSLFAGYVPASAQGKPAARPAPGSTTVGKGAAARDAVILEVGREKFTVGQIADAYQKNAQHGTSFYQLDRDSALKFLDLYSKYRLKVQAALEAGLDKKPEIIDELNNNRIQLAIPPPPQSGYLIERKVVDPAVERIFKLRGDEVKIGVIFSAMRANDPADTMRAYTRTLDMLNKLQHGASFSAMAVDSTDDPRAKQTGGELYVTSGMLFRPLEDAAYGTPVGRVNMSPIRVPSGYLIVKVISRSPRVKMKAAHIFFEVPPNDSTKDIYARQQAQKALDRLRSGESFEKVAKEMSEDKVSGANGGDLGSYYTRSLGFEAANAHLWSQFEDTLYNLKDGQISGIVRSGAGYHIIKRVASKVPSFDEEKETIRQLYKQQFLAEDRDAYVTSVLNRQGLRIDENVLRQVLASVNQAGTTADTAWAKKITPDLRATKFFSFHGTDYTVGAWIDSVEHRRELRASALHGHGIRQSVQFLMEPAAMEQEAKSLEQDYPEFAALMKEFRDGILIFKLEEDTIWNKLKYDEKPGKVFYEKNQKKYVSQPKLGLTEIFMYKESDAKDAYAKAEAKSQPFDTLAAQLTQRQGYRERAGRWEASTPKNSDLVKQVLAKYPNAKSGEILGPFEYQGGYSIVRVDNVEPVRPMTYEEAKPEVQGDYIDYLQKKLSDDWLGALRLKYGVKINDRVLDSALAAK